MKPYSADPARHSQAIDATISGYILALVAIAFALSMTWYIVSRLHIGIDVSDSAYYIISYAQHRDIESQSTLAGWLWASISPFHGVLANRYLGVVFLIACFTLLALEAWRVASDRWISLTIAVAFATAGSLVYYVHWLPDPSYNSMNLGFIALGWAGLFGLLHATSESTTIRLSEIVWTLVVGIAISSDFLAKPTSAALLGPTLLIFYLAATWRYLCVRRVLTLASTALVGLALPFIALSSIGETPDRVYTTLKNGVEAGVKIAPPALNPIQSFAVYVNSVIHTPLLHHWVTWIAVAFIVIGSSKALSSKLRLNAVARVGLNTSIAIAFPLFIWQSQIIASPDQAINGLLVLMFALAIYGSFMVSSRQTALLFCCAMVISPLIFAYGTGNQWGYMIVMVSAFPCAAIGIAVAASQGMEKFLIAAPGLGLLAAMLATTAVGIEKHPYRLSTPLSSLHSIAQVGPSRELLLESPNQALFYNKLAEMQPLVRQLPYRPYLIDLSGATPMVAFQIGAKAPRTPWLLGGYPGSKEVFHLIVSKISQQDLSRAWIFQTKDYKASIPDEVLRRYGLNFPARYVPLAVVPVEYLGVRGTLYAPADVIAGFGSNDLQPSLPK